MTQPDVRPRTSPTRRAAGTIVLLVGIAYMALTIYGVSNPQRFVIVASYSRNPFTGAFWLLLAMLFAWILVFPVRSPTEDFRRSQVRTTLIVLTVVGFLIAALIFLLHLFRYDPQTLATSPSGQRSVAVVLTNHYEMHVFAGTGWSKRDMGGLGTTCAVGNGLEAHFVSENEVRVSTPYNDYDIRLAADGTPINHFGASCSD